MVLIIGFVSTVSAQHSWKWRIGLRLIISLIFSRSTTAKRSSVDGLLTTCDKMLILGPFSFFLKFENLSNHGLFEGAVMGRRSHQTGWFWSQRLRYLNFVLQRICLPFVNSPQSPLLRELSQKLCDYSILVTSTSLPNYTIFLIDIFYVKRPLL